MTLIVYRDSEGTIVNHHPAPMQITGEDLAVAIEEYNERKQHGRTACIVEVAEGSFEAYLLERLDKKYRMAKEAIDEALDAIEEARNCINSLEVEK